MHVCQNLFIPVGLKGVECQIKKLNLSVLKLRTIEIEPKIHLISGTTSTGRKLREEKNQPQTIT